MVEGEGGIGPIDPIRKTEKARLPIRGRRNPQREVGKEEGAIQSLPTPGVEPQDHGVIYNEKGQIVKKPEPAKIDKKV